MRADVIKGRDANHITRNANSISWKQSTTEYVMKGNKIISEEQCLKVIYSQMRHRAVSLGHPNVPISFSPSGSYTDLKRVNIGLDYLRNPKYSFEQKVDIAKGLMSHELAHIKYTCKKTRDKWISKLNQNEYWIANQSLFQSIQNILEDERIETNLIASHGGVADDLAIVKEHYFGKVLSLNPQGQTQEQVALLLYAVRYPSSIPQELIDRNQEFYDFVCEQIDKLYNGRRLPHKKDYAEILQASLDIIKKFSIEEPKSDDESKDGADGQDGEKSEENESNDGQSESKTIEEILDEHAQKKQELDNEEASEEDLSQTRNEMRDLVNQVKNAMRDAEKQFEELDDASQEEIDSFRDISKSNDLSEITEEGKHVPTHKRIIAPYVNAKNEINEQKDFDAHHNAIKPLKAKLFKAMNLQFDCQVRKVNNLKNGKIKNLVGAHSGRADVFTRKPKIKQQKLNLAVLIDSSGSMEGEKMDIARDFAMLFYQTFHNSPNVDLWIYGIRFDDTEEYYNPKLKGQFKKRFAGLRSGGGNDDGHQILTLAEKVRSHNDEPCVMVCVSDGDPASKAHTRSAVKQVSKMGIHPIQIGIGTDYASRGNDLFDDYAEVNINDLYSRVHTQDEIRTKAVSDFSKIVQTKIARVLA
jgi:hypothetical protein